MSEIHSENDIQDRAMTRLNEDRLIPTARGVLSDYELEAVADRLWEKFSARFENIGYDLSTPTARDQIRKDHEWVREWRTGANKAKAAAVGAGITAFVGGGLWLMWSALKSIFRGTVQ